MAPQASLRFKLLPRRRDTDMEGIAPVDCPGPVNGGPSDVGEEPGVATGTTGTLTTARSMSRLQPD